VPEDIFFEVCEANSSIFESLNELFATYYSSTHPVRTPEFLNWFYLENPLGPAKFVTAKDGSLWIGIVVLIPLIIKNGSNNQKAYFAVNVLTHPSYRTKNLFVKMITLAKDTLSQESVWLIGHPNSNALPGWKRKKMEFRANLELFYIRSRGLFSGYKCRELSNMSDLEEIGIETWLSWNKNQNCQVLYSPDFISWKFLQAPHKNYKIIRVDKDKECVGLVIYRKFKGPFNILIDCLSAEKDKKNIVRASPFPTITMQPNLVSNPYRGSLIKLPFEKTIPFFVTTWEEDVSNDAMRSISLSASDF